MAVVPSYGQHQLFTMKVMDMMRDESVAFANVLIEGLKSGEKKYFVTFIEGTFQSETKEISKFSIS